MASYDYDLIVIGSGPAGHRAAIQAAKAGKNTALVERKGVVGGVSINSGTIPSKTLREAVMHLSGYNQRGMYGQSYRVKQKIGMKDLLHRTDQVIRNEIDVAHHQLHRNISVSILPHIVQFAVLFMPARITLTMTTSMTMAPLLMTMAMIMITIMTVTTMSMQVMCD